MSTTAAYREDWTEWDQEQEEAARKALAARQNISLSHTTTAKPAAKSIQFDCEKLRQKLLSFME